ncbi:MAG TPA: glycosyltransferase family 4 protein [Anaerolineae bacterium]
MNSTMHIGLIVYGRLDSVSGGYLYDRKLVEYLRRQGDRVEIISLPWSNYGRHLAHNFLSGPFNRLRHASFDVLLQDELNHPSLFWLNRRLRRRRYPIISIVHHLRLCETRPVWQNSIYTWIEKQYLASVDGFIFNSQTTQTVVQGLVGSHRPCVVAYPAGDRLQPSFDPEVVTARAHEPGPLRLLFVGNLTVRKSLDTLLAALMRLPAESWRLEVVGDTTIDPAYTRRIRQQVEAAGLGHQVTLHSSLSDQALRQHFCRSHLLAVPSRYEGFGIVYLEGMGFGLPAIAGAAGAAGEIVSHGQNGFLVRVEETAELAAYVDCLHRDRDRLVQMSLAARRRYQHHPTWDESMGHVRRFLLEIGDYPLP